MSRALMVVSWLLVALLASTGCQQAAPEAEAPVVEAEVAAPEAEGVEAEEVEAETPENAEAEDAAPNETSETAGEETNAEEIEVVSAIPEVTFIAVEYAFDGPDTIPAGWTRIQLDNQGDLEHEFILAKLDEGKTIDDVIADFEAESEESPDWVQMYGAIVAEPGASNFYIVDLTPGNYVYLSFGDEEDGPPDAARGMLGALTVIEATEAVEVALPEPDLTIDLLDYTFALSGPMAAGEQTIQVNNLGEETHHIIIFRLHEEATLEDFNEFFGSEGPPAGPPPADFYGLLGEHGPGLGGYYSMDFAPGNYVFICFLPSEAHDGAPHVALGMVQEVTVE